MVGPRTAHQRLQNSIFQLLLRTFLLQQMLENGYIKGKLIEFAE